MTSPPARDREVAREIAGECCFHPKCDSLRDKKNWCYRCYVATEIAAALARVREETKGDQLSRAVVRDELDRTTTALVEAEAEVERLKRSRDGWRADAEREAKNVEHWKSKLQQAESALAAAREHMQHKPDCNTLLDDESDQVLYDYQECTCGLDAALAAESVHHGPTCDGACGPETGCATGPLGEAFNRLAAESGEQVGSGPCPECKSATCDGHGNYKHPGASDTYHGPDCRCIASSDGQVCGASDTAREENDH